MERLFISRRQRLGFLDQKLEKVMDGEGRKRVALKVDALDFERWDRRKRMRASSFVHEHMKLVIDIYLSNK
jgi:hypothetical protein